MLNGVIDIKDKSFRFLNRRIKRNLKLYKSSKTYSKREEYKQNIINYRVAKIKKEQDIIKPKISKRQLIIKQRMNKLNRVFNEV